MDYKILSYLRSGEPRSGLLVGGKVLDVADVTGSSSLGTVLGILDTWSATKDILADISRSAPAGGTPLDQTKLLAPILYPGEIWAAAANYRDHIEEMAAKGFTVVNAKTIGGRPLHFGKSSRSGVIGHGTQYCAPRCNALDWEIELAAVIGRVASQVSAADALDYVAGYTVANDLSARDLALRAGIPDDSPFRYDYVSSKGFDGSLPMGPWITPADAIGDPQCLDLKLWVDGQLMQDSNTDQMIFSIAEQIEEISARVTMHPGDVVLTGTPAGVGMASGMYLKPGQQVRLWIQNIGYLEHGVA